MSRQPRILTDVGVYHVILRSVNHQVIFEHQMDFQIFLQVLELYKRECGFKIFAYCLMSNHIHMLIQVGETPLAQMMKRIEVKYAMNYNYYYHRDGALFQDRFKSEPVKNDEYFLTAARYIMQNPMHAGLEDKPGTYRWSSYFDYVNMDNTFVNVDIMRNYFESRTDMLDFFETDSKEQCMEYYNVLPDEEAINIMKKETSCNGPQDFFELGLTEREEYVKILLSAGISIRQLQRITGVPRRVIEMVSKRTNIMS